MRLTPFGVLCVSMGYTVVIAALLIQHVNLRFKEHMQTCHSPGGICLAPHVYVWGETNTNKNLDNP